MKMLRFLALGLINTTFAATFANNTSYEVCFTPDNNCTNLIVRYIDQAKTSINVQAYSFTSAPIAKALVDAKQRGLAVNIVLDKSQVKHNRYSAANYFIHQKIPVWVDYKPAIAHNKVMVIDGNIVITGSFNFTKAAQMKNAENVLIVRNEELANKYMQNLAHRQAVSKMLA